MGDIFKSVLDECLVLLAWLLGLDLLTEIRSSYSHYQKSLCCSRWAEEPIIAALDSQS